MLLLILGSAPSILFFHTEFNSFGGGGLWCWQRNKLLATPAAVCNKSLQTVTGKVGRCGRRPRPQLAFVRWLATLFFVCAGKMCLFFIKKLFILKRSIIIKLTRAPSQEQICRTQIGAWRETGAQILREHLKQKGIKLKCFHVWHTHLMFAWEEGVRVGESQIERHASTGTCPFSKATQVSLDSDSSKPTMKYNRSVYPTLVKAICAGLRRLLNQRRPWQITAWAGAGIIIVWMRQRHRHKVARWGTGKMGASFSHIRHLASSPALFRLEPSSISQLQPEAVEAIKFQS